MPADMLDGIIYLKKTIFPLRIRVYVRRTRTRVRVYCTRTYSRTCLQYNIQVSTVQRTLIYSTTYSLYHIML